VLAFGWFGDLVGQIFPHWNAPSGDIRPHLLHGCMILWSNFRVAGDAQSQASTFWESFEAQVWRRRTDQAAW
jgi:hypothetical protein